MALGPADNYKRDKNHLDSLGEAFSLLKQELNRHGWNVPIEQQEGLTMTMEGPDKIVVSHAKYVVASPFQMNRKEKPNASAYVSDMVNQLKKKYQEVANTPMTLNKVDEQQVVQLYSRNSPDKSWAWGTTYGPAISRYIITTSQTLSVKSKLLSND